MKITISQINADPSQVEKDWSDLIAHCKAEKTEIVLLPEMPFSPWFAASKDVQEEVWNEAVQTHETWMQKLHELEAQIVIASKPIVVNNKRLNMGFIWTPESGILHVHSKVYLPDEEGFWEASWYDRGPKEFTSIEINNIRIGFLICSEL